MKKLKIYLDTSVISHLQADDVPDKTAKTLEFWDCIEQGVFSSKYMDDATHVAAASVIGCTARRRICPEKNISVA